MEAHYLRIYHNSRNSKNTERVRPWHTIWKRQSFSVGILGHHKNWLYFGLRSTDYGLRITGYGLRVTEYGVRSTDYGLRITDYGVRISDYTEYGVRITVYGVRVKGYRLRRDYGGITGYGLRSTEYGVRSTEYGVRRDYGLRCTDYGGITEGLLITDYGLRFTARNKRFCDTWTRFLSLSTQLKWY